MKEQGQVIIAILLTLLVALTIGLTITQRSISDVTTSTQTEESSRAFSAAEAGLEKSIQSGTALGTVDLGNASSIVQTTRSLLPTGSEALEYPPIGKETIAQFWLADPNSSADPNNLTPFYQGSSFDFYYGDENLSSSSTDLPAVEVNVITKSGNTYSSYRYFYDSSQSRVFSNGFKTSTCGGTSQTDGIITSSSPTIKSKFYCRVTVPPVIGGCSSPTCNPYVGTPILVRARVLYSNASQKIALAPTGAGKLPPQAELYTSTGLSGQSQKVLQTFRMKYVVPPFFDFAIFSAGDIQK